MLNNLICVNEFWAKEKHWFIMCSENFKAILSLDVCTMNFGIVAFNEAEKYNLLFIYSYLWKKNPSWLE